VLHGIFLPGVAFGRLLGHRLTFSTMRAIR
jgi:hypothetical protein